jgi:hypothetical protein
MDIQKGTSIFDLFDKMEPPRPKMDSKDVLCAFDIKFCTMCNVDIKNAELIANSNPLKKNTKYHPKKL